VPAFEYQIFIRSSPEKVWHGLTDPLSTVKWWHVQFESTWHQGSTYAVTMGGVTIADDEQRILISERPWRLEYTWHTFTPEWAATFEFDESLRAAFAAEPRSVATFDIEPRGDVTQLRLTHRCDIDGQVLGTIRDGWPPLLSSLKSLLETGEALSF
jgi:uncharacterized protein YndB with AHSA1/START domain